MTETGVADSTPIKDFTRQRKRILFRIDGDVFEATPALPGDTLVQFATRFADIDGAPMSQKLDILAEALGMVLLPNSLTLFRRRFADLERPIEYDQAQDIVVWLMEHYGKRPTQPSSASSTGPASPVSGTNSMDVAQPQVSIPATFQPTAS